MNVLVLPIILLLVSVPVLAAEKLEVAQYIADVDDVSWRVGSDSNSLSRDDRVMVPLGSSTYQTSTTLGREFNVGRYRLSGIFDMYHQQHYDADRPTVQESSISVGSGFALSPNSIMHLFHSISEGQEPASAQVNRLGMDTQSQRTGLTQTWYFARRRAHITMGYEFERGDTENLYEDMRGHSLVLSSRFPLFWGLSARLQANYALNSYQDYQGLYDADSDKHQFAAAIDHSLTQRLYGEIRFSYLNEDFDDEELSYRRTIWGLNLRYRY